MHASSEFRSVRGAPAVMSLALAALALTLSAAARADEAVVTFDSLLEEMTDFRRLAEFPEPAYTCRQFSSYDRDSTSPDDEETWFANRDAGNYLYLEYHDEREEAVMMDADGPGAVVRFWSANPKGTVRFYLDGAEEPAIEMPMNRLLGGGGPVGEPLSATRSRGWNLYLPIPYAEHCRITCDDPKGVYYQINYRTYEPGTAVEAFRDSFFQEKADLIEAVGRRLLDPVVESDDAEYATEFVETGDTLELLELEGPGAISEMKIYMESPSIPMSLRTCIMKIEFDGRPAVYCPLGDFYGMSPALNRYESWPFAVRGDITLTSRWFMPYAKSAKFSFINMGNTAVEIRLWLKLADYQWNDRSMHFNAVWRNGGAIQTRPRSDFNYATIEGDGVWVGNALHITNPVADWWGEGDEKIYVDGETFPSHFGTGTEDYYGYAWCNNQLFHAPFHNQTRCDGPGNFGYTSVNRFRMLDAIPFNESLRFDMEIWHWQDTRLHVAATSYFYTRSASHNVQPVTDPRWLVVPSVQLYIFTREGAVEGEDLEIVGRKGDFETEVQQLGRGLENTWSNMKHLWCKTTQIGQAVTFHVPTAEPGPYEVILYLTKSYDYGVLQCAVNGEEAGGKVDTFNVNYPRRIGVPAPHSLGVHELARDGFDLTVEVVGSNGIAQEPRTYWGLDCIILKPVDG